MGLSFDWVPYQTFPQAHFLLISSAVTFDCVEYKSTFIFIQENFTFLNHVHDYFWYSQSKYHNFYQVSYNSDVVKQFFKKNRTVFLIHLLSKNDKEHQRIIHALNSVHWLSQNIVCYALRCGLKITHCSFKVQVTALMLYFHMAAPLTTEMA